MNNILLEYNLIYPINYYYNNEKYKLKKIKFLRPNGSFFTNIELFPIINGLKDLTNNYDIIKNLKDQFNISEINLQEKTTEISKLYNIISKIAENTFDKINNDIINYETKIYDILKNIYFRHKDDNIQLLSFDGEREGVGICLDEYKELDFEDIKNIFSALKKKCLIME